MMGFGGVVKVDDVAGELGGLGEVDWNDRDAIKKWIERQPRQHEWLLKVRSSLRIFPSSSHVNREKFDQFLILRFRATLTSALVGYLERYSDKDEVLIENAMEASNEQFMEFANANPDIRLAVHVDSIPGQMELESEALQFDSRQSVKVLQQTQLWPTNLLTEEMLSRLQVFDEKMKHSESWVFWADWFRGMWDGTWTDWDLAFEVAMIEADVWEKGLEAVATRIREIEAKLAIIKALEEIPTTETLAVADRHGIGGNAPPESLDDIGSVTMNATVVWSGVEALEAEIKAENPSAERVNAAISLLTKGLGACVAWLGRKGDLATDETIKALAKWGAPLGGAYYLANPSQLQALIDAAKNWVSFLP